MLSDTEIAALSEWSRAVLALAPSEIVPSLGRFVADLLQADSVVTSDVRRSGAGQEPTGVPALQRLLSAEHPIHTLEGAKLRAVLGPTEITAGAWLGGQLGRKVLQGYVHLFREQPFDQRDVLVMEHLCAVATLALKATARLEEAAAAEDRLRRFLNSSLDLICTVARDGRFLEVSANSTEILGYAPAELIGRSIMDFVHPEDRAATLKRAVRSQPGGHRAPSLTDTCGATERWSTSTGRPSIRPRTPAITAWSGT